MTENVLLNLERIGQECRYGVKKCSRCPDREAQKSLQETILSYRNQSGRNRIMMRPVEEYNLNLGIMPHPMIPIEPSVNCLYPFEIDDEIQDTESGKKHERKPGISDHQIPWSNQNDVRQYTSAIGMQDFQSHIDRKSTRLNSSHIPLSRI